MFSYFSCSEELRKLFVGMLSKTCSEDDIHQMFEPFGPIEGISILRHQDRTSKGVVWACVDKCVCHFLCMYVSTYVCSWSLCGSGYIRICISPSVVLV